MKDVVRAAVSMLKGGRGNKATTGDSYFVNGLCHKSVRKSTWLKTAFGFHHDKIANKISGSLSASEESSKATDDFVMSPE
jgi:hypothetical protein